MRSLRENAHHLNTSPFTSYNYHGKGNCAALVDVVVLGATEVDVNFNANVVTHSDGYLLRGLALNPLREDLRAALSGSSLPFRTLTGIQQDAHNICGGPPAQPKLNRQHPVAVVKWVDGTVLDTIHKVVE